MATKIYIAGKITGDPDYKTKFNAAAEAYKKKGYTVLNPSWMPEGVQKADYMRICFAMIDTADVVAFLPGYRLSAGAQLELQYCFYIDKDVKLPDDEAEGPALQPSAVQNGRNGIGIEINAEYEPLIKARIGEYKREEVNNDG